jgi:hypothetical protein
MAPAPRFLGAVEALGRTRVSGWVRCEADGARLPVRVELRLAGHPPLPLSTIVERPEGLGFIFDLPAACHAMPWRDFVAAFDAVLAMAEGAGTWRVPLYKSVLLGRDLVPAEQAQGAGNATTLVADVLRPYRSTPATEGRVAAFTLAQGDNLLLGLWARHHAAAFGAAHLYVLDPGVGADGLPDGVNVVRLPALPGDAWAPVRTSAMFQRFLLETYDATVFLDPDALLCAAPALAEGRGLAEMLLALPQPHAIPAAWRLWHDIAAEGEYDPARPLLAQRRMLVRDASLERPLVNRLPANWRPGPPPRGEAPVPGLHAIHLRTFDLDHALVEIPRRTDGRLDGAEIVNWFKVESRAFAEAFILGFDPAAPRTMAASWMREAIRV